MAGTSPDRSKRYESSTESTPGNEPAVPDPGGSAPDRSSGSAAPSPDPRLAMSRPATPKPDQATAVFSRRALLEAAEAEGAADAAGAAETAGPDRDEPKPGRPDTTDTEERGGARTPAEAPADDSADADIPAQGGPTEPATPVSGSASEDETDEDEDEDEDTGTEPAAGDEAEGGDAHPRERGAAAAAADAGDPENAAKAADAARETDAEETTAGDAAETADGGRGPSDDEPEAAADGAADGGREFSGDEPEVADDVRAGSDDEPEAVDDVPERSGDEPGAAPGERRPAGDRPEAADGTGGEAGGDGGAEARRAVDQPTAIFRAPKPPAVDHPTTMLKLGDAVPKDTEPAKADAEPAKADAAPKADAVPKDTDADKAPDGDKGARADGEVDEPATPPAERTSKFVALKSLDETTTPRPTTAPGPAAPPPPAPAEATRALPQVGPERTTQQPLPPKPPLDLLAELTNTPPPRQTPVRTLIRRVKIWTPLVILLVIVFAVVQAVRPLPTPTLALTADASYAFEGDKVSLPWPDEGQGWMDVEGIGTMDSFGEQKPVAIGSVAKAMTAYVILKEHPMKPGSKGKTIPVDAKAETEGGYDKDGESTLNTVKEGDQLSQYDAIAAIMIPSANNIARLLARWDSKGSEADFVKKMNAAAKDLGMKNTTYTDPSGLKETTVSTAEDQVKLGNELVKMKALTDITRLPSWKDPSGQPWSNYNRLVPYDNAIGIKTGSTTAAGGNLLFAATKDVGGETAIVVGAILGQHTPPIIDTVNAVSKTAMIAAQDALTSDTILKKGDVVGYVDDGLGGQTPVVATKNVSAVGWAGKTVKLELDASATIPHAAKSGTEVGTLIVGDGAGEGVEVPVALQKPLTEPDFLTKLTRVS
ncbi:D-alanyl-D-alanine carboxypeptidase [Streptomyces scabiei]|uniref:D-alanyl-D-alanine carboxypeptidase n=1 Tax=Streptomyces scabiei TaxID=1930 RepID=UPI0036E543C3